MFLLGCGAGPFEIVGLQKNRAQGRRAVKGLYNCGVCWWDSTMQEAPKGAQIKMLFSKGKHTNSERPNNKPNSWWGNRTLAAEQPKIFMVAS